MFDERYTLYSLIDETTCTLSTGSVGSAQKFKPRGGYRRRIVSVRSDTGRTSVPKRKTHYENVELEQILQ